jgi:hypothetical protein
MHAKQQKFSIGYSIAIVVALLLIQAVFFQPHAENLSYSEFKALAKKGKVSNLVLDKQTITGILPAEGLEGLLPKEKLEELKRAGAGTHPFVYGMSEVLGLATFDAPRQALFLDVPPMAQREYSEETARKIDAEIEQLLETAHGRVRETLGKKRVILDALAKRLIEKEVVDRAALTQLIADTESLPPRVAGDRGEAA